MRDNTFHILPRALRGIALLLAIALPLASCHTGSQRRYVAVTVDVDFGPADHLPRSSRVMVPEGSSAVDAIASFLEIERGFVCCTRSDLWSVEGVATDPAANHYWIWQLNGRSGSLAPDRHKLANGDHVSWFFAETQKPQHRRN